MKPISISRLLLILTTLVLGGLATPTCQGATEPTGLSIRIKDKEGRLEVLRGDRSMLVYAFAPSQFKPYVKELRTLEGANVVVDSPPDHLHHHGLMFAIRVNGNNFWEEREKPGRERHVEFIDTRTSVHTRGQVQAVFSERLHWVADEFKDATDTKPHALVVELRTITLTLDDKSGEVAVRWDAEFEVGPGAEKVRLEGADYHGLGMRLPPSFDKVARHRNSELKAYKTADQRDVIEARWSAITGTLEGREVTVACMGRPEVQKGALRFFTMLDPFAYLSATRGLDLVPQDYKRGEAWRDSYLVVVRSSAVSTESLEQRYQAWLKQNL